MQGEKITNSINGIWGEVRGEQNCQGGGGDVTRYCFRKLILQKASTTTNHTPHFREKV